LIIALDATYSLGRDLSGVGVYSRELLGGLAGAHPESGFQFCYRPHRFLRSLQLRLPANSRRCLLGETRVPRGADVFHGLNQRLPRAHLRRTVTTFHDLFVLTGEYSTVDFRRRFSEQARQAAERSDRIIAVSHFTASQVIGLLGVDPGKITVVHHGVHAPPSVSLAREKIILHVGAIQRRKNIGRLVEAFGKLDREWHLVLAGATGYGAPEILARISGSACRDRIHVLGYVPDAELANWYARAMIFAFPSLDEGFGMPVLDAMASGLPVIASNRSAIPEVAGDAAWLVNPEDTSELVGALSDLTRDACLRADLSRRGILRAAQFSWTEAVQKTWCVYQQLAARER
jgi:glycosyltransferase involved in cell wall biosynthesis